MRLLLDTHVLLWTVAMPERLPEAYRTAITDPANTIFFSTINIWEIAIKSGLRKAGFEVEPEMVLGEAEALGFVEQRVTSRQTILAGTLPLHHRDPFDRLLIAQAMLEPARLVTADRTLVQYSELVDLI